MAVGGRSTSEYVRRGRVGPDPLRLEEAEMLAALAAEEHGPIGETQWKMS